ncbi:MAG: PAS domain S-box protein [Opitutaceae bacterium]|nr:PAS domain S-box protein [Opitutaceae bacterium]
MYSNTDSVETAAGNSTCSSSSSTDSQPEAIPACGGAPALCTPPSQIQSEQEEGNFRTFVQTIDDLILVATPGGRIVFSNAAVERKLGYSAIELSRLSLLDLHPPEVRDEAAAVVAAIVKGERQTCPFPLRRKDGSFLPVETRTWFGQWNGQPCLFGTCKDLSAEQEAQQRFEQLFRRNPMPMALTSTADRRFADVNNAWLGALGYERSDVIGKTSAELDLFPEPARLDAVAAERKANGVIRDLERRVRTRSGTLRDALFSGEALEIQGRSYFLTVMQDITARRQAEEALRESELRFRLLIENAPDGVARVSPQGKFLYASPTARRMFGQDDTPLAEIDPLQSTHPEDQSRVLAALTEILEHPEQVRTLQYRFRHANGGWLWIESTFTNLIGRPGVDSLVVNFRNIHDRKLAEEALAAEATRRRILVEGSLDGIVVLDTNGKVYEANRRFAEMLGYTAEEVRQLHVMDWDRTWSHAQVLEAIRILGPQGDHFESRHWRKDGSWYDVELSNSSAEVSGQKLVFCVCRDITERKRSEAMLRESLLFRREAEKIARIGAWKVSPATDYLYWTEGVYEIVEAPLDYHPGLQEGLQLYDKESIPVLQAALESALRDGTPFVVETGVTTLTGRHLWAEVRGLGRVEDHGQAFVMGTFQDITARKRSEALTARENLRTRFLLELHQRAPHMSDQELYDHVLERAVLLTDSASGFFHLISADQRTSSLSTWSRDVQKCTTTTFDTRDLTSESGPWVDCRCQHQPIIDNDCAHSRIRQGLPSGHASWTRFMSVPVVQDGKTRIIFGVGDKASDYHEDDFAQVRLVANELHKIMVQRSAQAQLLQLSRAVEQSPACVSISDTAGAIEYVNPKFSEVTGFSLEDIRGCGPLGLGSAELTPEDIRGLWDTLRAGREWHREFRNRRKNGEWYWQAATVSPITRSPGLISHVVMVAEDIADRKRLESFREVLLTLGRQLNGTTDATSASRALLDAADRLWQWDAAALDMIQNDRGQVRAVISVDTIDGLRQNVPAVANELTPRTRRVLQHGAQLTLREENAAFGPDVVPFGDVNRPSRSIMDVPIHRDTQIVGIFSLHSYRTQAFSPEDLKILQALADYCGGALERIRSEEAARASEERYLQSQKLEAIGQLAGGVAHDFNNILAAMMMNLGMLQENANLDPETLLSLDELGRATNRAASLTRQLLMFSRRSVMASKPLDLNEVVDNLLKMLRRLIGEQVSLRFDGLARLPLVEADAGMLEQVLMNLVVNARDAMPKGGTITIATSVRELREADRPAHPESRPGRFVCLSTIDTGIGMAAETKKRIFEPFFTTKEAGAGTGLGLATVHGIVAQHKGWVEVESALGRGTTFRIYLPALLEAPAAPRTPELTAPVQRGQETILLVEDDATLRRFATLALEAFGYRVLAASNGQEAVALWQAGGDRCDLVLTDMVMPEGMTGLELVERLREMKPGLRAIVSSGYSTEITRPGVLTKAGVVYLPKPYETRTLAEVVRSALDDSG